MEDREGLEGIKMSNERIQKKGKKARGKNENNHENAWNERKNHDSLRYSLEWNCRLIRAGLEELCWYMIYKE